MSDAPLSWNFRTDSRLLLACRVFTKMTINTRGLLQFLCFASFLVYITADNESDTNVAVKMKSDFEIMCNFSNDCCPKWNGNCCCGFSYHHLMTSFSKRDGNITGSGLFVDNFRTDMTLKLNGSDVGGRRSYRDYENNYEIKDISEVFFQYNYSYQNIPANLAHIGTQLLDAESVRYFRDYDDEVVFLGKGSFGEVYLAEMVESKQVVAVKLFLDSDYLDIISEVIITQYLCDTGVIPKIIGLLPTGPMTSNLSLVQEYVSGMTLEDHLNEENETTLISINWLNISLQLAVGLQKIHQKYVLLNDIHEGNVLVEPPHLRVVYIDMGHATFRSGYKYNNYNGSLYTYEHLAPELRKSQPGTPASDVYSLGSLLSRISNISRIRELERLANRCLHNQPEMRPTLSDLVISLKDIFEQEKQKIERKRVKFQDFSNIKSISYPPLIHYNVPILGPDSITDIQNRTQQDEDLKNEETGTNSTLDPMYIYLGGTRAKVHIGTLNHCNCVVMIRAYENGSFERILEESRILLHLKDTGAVFPFHGLLPTGSLLDEFEIVQSYFVRMVSVANIFQRFSLRMTDTEILSFFIHISVHLLEVHRKGVLLNYLNEENIMIDPENTKNPVWFSDLSRATYNDVYIFPVEDADLSGFKFLAPEVRAGSATSAASDIYSLCYVYKLVLDRLHKRTYAEFVNHCLAKDPEMRPSIPEIIMDLRSLAQLIQ